MYKLDFTEDNRDLFDAAYSAIAGGDPPQPTEWDDYLSLLRKFRKVGQPTETIGKLQMYGFQQPCCLELERGEARILKERIERPIWTPGGLEKAIQLRDTLRGMADENGVKL